METNSPKNPRRNHQQEDISSTKSAHETLDYFLPEQEEIVNVKRIQNFVKEKLIIQMERWNIKGSLVFTGSTALGTFIRGDLDIDLFVIVELETFEEFRQVFYHFSDLKWLKNQHIKHGNAPNRDVMTHRLAIWSGTLESQSTQQYDLDLVILPKVRGKSPHTRFETVRHVKFFKKHLTLLQKRDVVRLKGLFKLGGIYGADQWSIKGVDCQTLIYRYKTLEGALNFLSNLTLKSQLMDPSYEEVQIDRDLFATIFQSPLSVTRLKQIVKIAKNYLEEKNLPSTYDKNEWIETQIGAHCAVFSLPPQGADRAETFSKVVSTVNNSLNQLKGTISELRDIKSEIDARLFEQTTVVSLKLPPVTPKFQRSLDKRKLDPKQRKIMIERFKKNSLQRAIPPLIIDIQIVETSETVTSIFRRNPIFAQFLALRVVQNRLEQNGFSFEGWVEPLLTIKKVQPYFKIDGRINETVILNDLEIYARFTQNDDKPQVSRVPILEPYYTLVVYLQFPNLLGISNKIEKQLQQYLSKKIESIPKSLLIQIASLYHKIGLRTPSNGKNGTSTDKQNHSKGRTVLEMSGPKMGLTKNQINYVKTLINASHQLDINFDFQILRKIEKTTGINLPDFILLGYAIKSPLNRTLRNTWNPFLRRALQEFFTVYKERATDSVL